LGRGDDDETPGSAAERDGPIDSTAPADAPESAEPDRESDDSSGSDGAADAPPVDEELLSNEEQVLRLLEANGGRMKQKQVVEELDWTAAKTSQVVTGLRDADDLDGFRLGRENVLSLPGYEATGDGEATDGAETDEASTDGAATDDKSVSDDSTDDTAGDA
ncbi:helix-turn-helix transcriptional regulator, partial [Halorubrum pallidum]